MTPLGRPLPNCRVYVVDGEFRLCPIGVPGELMIAGDQVARGYVRRAEATAEKFIPDPFSGQPGARMYRTGDLARVLSDGTLEFLGRNDHQVKVRGFRIELGEVEAAIREQPQVEACAATTRLNHAGDRELVAYVVARTGTFSVPALRQSLRGSLPDFMFPASIIVLPALPLNPFGKVDLTALPAPAVDAPLADRESVSRTERLVLRIWEEILDRQGLLVTDDFFDVGGSSLAAIKVNARLRQLIDFELPLRTLFEATTAGDLAEVLDSVGDRQLP